MSGFRGLGLLEPILVSRNLKVNSSIQKSIDLKNDESHFKTQKEKEAGGKYG